jgi:hypothetical protein
MAGQKKGAEVYAGGDVATSSNLTGGFDFRPAVSLSTKAVDKSVDRRMSQVQIVPSDCIFVTLAKK